MTFRSIQYPALALVLNLVLTLALNTVAVHAAPALGSIASQKESSSKKKRSYQEEEAQIPTLPSAPPLLKQRVAPHFFQCERHFLYQGKRIELDSNVSRDAAGLLAVVRDVPSALLEVQKYRENRETMRIAGYAGTVGLLAIIAGTLISHPPINPETGVIRPGGYSILSGLIITGTSLTIGFSASRANKNHLERAVENFNAVHPDQPIQLQLGAGFNF